MHLTSSSSTQCHAVASTAMHTPGGHGTTPSATPAPETLIHAYNDPQPPDRPLRRPRSSPPEPQTRRSSQRKAKPTPTPSPDCCTRHSHRIAGISIDRASERAICAAEEKRGNCADMAMLLDAGVVGCAAQLAPTGASSSSSSSSSSSPCVAGMGVRSLPVARGLRIFSSRTRLSSPPASQSSVRSQRRGVLCEAQETVTGGIPMHSAMLFIFCERIPGSAFPRVCTPHAFPMSIWRSPGVCLLPIVQFHYCWDSLAGLVVFSNSSQV